MVVQRTIKHLKTRPHHERRAVAVLTAFAVVVILFLLWVYQLFATIRAQSQTPAVQTTTQQ
jgi:type II secretory pathway component PulM